MRVVIKVDGSDGEVHQLEGPNKYLIGRLPMSHIKIKDGYVSRMHLMMELTSSNCYIWDLDSLNGTKVNGEKVQDAELKDGDVIEIGKTSLHVKIDKKESYQCYKCGKDITEQVQKALNEAGGFDEIGKEDLLCEECLRKGDPFLKRAKGAFKPKREQGMKKPQVEYCFLCKKNDVKNVNADKKFDEFEGVALYICDRCADREQENAAVSKIGDYRILRELGEGGFGKVYMAMHKKSNRLVALKQMREELVLKDKAGKLFQREMSILQNLIHPNIVRLMDQGVAKGEHYFVSEYLTGGDAQDYIRKNRITLGSMCEIMCQSLEGLHFAHEMGYVHRDIKPQNILLTEDGVAKISDFGLARNYEKHGSGIDRTGDVSGTIVFMSPEQMLNYKYVEPPADVYSIGVTFYVMLTGRFPFEISSASHQLVENILTGERKPIEEYVDIPKSIARIVNKSVQIDEKKRYKSAKEMKEAIEKAIGV